MSNMYKRKTYDMYELRYDYGYGSGEEVIDRCTTYLEAKQDRRAYIENERIYPRIVRVREPIVENKN